MRIFLCGDVMTGRGIDQVLPHPCDPRLHEGYVGSAMDYVRLAERANGTIPMPVDLRYIWGAALAEFERARPDARIVNLETSITRSDSYVPKGINYRMSPENAGCLVAAGVDCCVLGNNHVLDWGRAGLLDTLATLRRLQIGTAGAGRDAAEAMAPAIIAVAGGGASGEGRESAEPADAGRPDTGRILVFSFASTTSGVPPDWAATPRAAGVNMLPEPPEAAIAPLARAIARVRRAHDVVVVSVHWGPNWGHAIADEQRRLAHQLIDRAGVSIVHGHSSHHAKAIEVHHGRLVLYGCGDFIDDYEGIRGYEAFRADLAVMYFADLALGSGELAALELVPLRMRRFQLTRATPSDVAWLRHTLNRESRHLGTRLHPARDGRLTLSWPGAASG